MNKQIYVVSYLRCGLAVTTHNTQIFVVTLRIWEGISEMTIALENKVCRENQIGKERNSHTRTII